MSGVVIMLLMAWLFGLIAEDVVDGDRLIAADAPLAAWCHRHATQPVLGIMWMFTWVGSVISVSLLTAIAAWCMRRKPYWLLALMVVVPGGMALNVALKHAFHRQRPHFDDPMLTLSTYSDPSGHALGSTLLFGFLCIVWIAHHRKRRWPVVTGTIVLIGGVAISRVYLGAHYLTDVIGGIAIGIAWLAICMSAVAALHRKRHPETSRLLAIQ